MEYTLPGEPLPPAWDLVVDTADATPNITEFSAGDRISVPGRGIVILQSGQR